MSLEGAAGDSFPLSPEDTSLSKYLSTMSSLSIESLVVKMVING